MKGPICRWNVQEMRSEQSEYLWKTTGASFLIVGEPKKALETYFEEHAKEVWERHWMNSEMHTTLLNMNIQKLM